MSARIVSFSRSSNRDIDVIDVLEEVEELPDITPPDAIPSNSFTNVRPSGSNHERRIKPYSRPPRNNKVTSSKVEHSQTNCETSCDNNLLLSHLDMLKSQYSEKARNSTKYNSSSLNATFDELISSLENAAVLHRRAMDKLASLQKAEEKLMSEVNERRLRRTLDISQREEIRQELEQCVICYSEKKNVVIVPCGHCFCNTCALRMGERCGFCREMVHDVVAMKFTN
jgi:hypothetical protein